MNKKALTLIELIVTIVTGFIVAMAITVLFISEFRLREKMKDQIIATREAEAAIDAVSRILRFAIPSSIPEGTDQMGNQILYGGIFVKVGHLPSAFPEASIDATYTINYTWYYNDAHAGIKAGDLRFGIANWTGVLDDNVRFFFVAQHLTNFSIEEEPGGDGEWFIISATAQKNEAVVTLSTTIKAIGALGE